MFNVKPNEIPPHWGCLFGQIITEDMNCEYKGILSFNYLSPSFIFDNFIRQCHWSLVLSTYHFTIQHSSPKRSSYYLDLCVLIDWYRLYWNSFVFPELRKVRHNCEWLHFLLQTIELLGCLVVWRKKKCFQNLLTVAFQKDFPFKREYFLMPSKN